MPRRLPGYRLSPSICCALLVAAVFLPSAAARGENYYFGIDFLDEITEVPAFPFIDDQMQSNASYHPAPLTDPNSNAVQDGGLAGWSEEDARAAVALAVEHDFRAVDTGNPDTTLRIAIFNGSAPASLDGRRLNTAVGHNLWSSELLLGQSLYGAYDDPGVPQDLHASMAQPPHMDQLSGIDITTSEDAINLFSGTISHEIGHNFYLGHVDRGDQEPYPLMATASTGLENVDRLTKRRFAPAHEADLTARIGTVNRADFDMDDDVDFAEDTFGDDDGISDLNILIANVGSTSAHMHHGDADMDGDVDFAEYAFGDDDGISDLNILIANVGSGAGDLGTDSAGDSGTAELVYNYVTGEVWFDNADSTINLIELAVNPGEGLALDPTKSGDYQGAGPNEDTTTVLQYFVPSGLGTGEDQVGAAGYMTTGLTELVQGTDVLFRYQRAGEQLQDGVITIVPEPATMLLLGLGGAAALIRRKK